MRNNNRNDEIKVAFSIFVIVLALCSLAGLSYMEYEDRCEENEWIDAHQWDDIDYESDIE